MDIATSFTFYVDVLGLKPIMKCSWSAYFLAGDVWIAVVQGEARTDNRYDHIAFQVDPVDHRKLVAKLIEAKCTVWKENETEGDSFYFFSIPGNKFELHYSSLKSRIADGKANWGNDVTWVF
jgi:catechol 2,3-dioxygenase-like lactoylglutathione lyase family enzyme